MVSLFSDSEVSPSSERPRQTKSFSSEPAGRFISSSSGSDEKLPVDEEEEEEESSSPIVLYFFGGVSSSAPLAYLRLLSLEAIVGFLFSVIDG
jgi:hypothetical protein